jgi:hypothetical protein
MAFVPIATTDHDMLPSIAVCRTGRELRIGTHRLSMSALAIMRS